MLRFRGSQCFRQRIVCATIAGKPIRIDDIRSDDENPGLRDYEASLLRLLEKITNGCIIEINETGALREVLRGGMLCSALPCCCCTFLPRLVLPLCWDYLTTQQVCAMAAQEGDWQTLQGLSLSPSSVAGLASTLPALLNPALCPASLRHFLFLPSVCTAGTSLRYKPGFVAGGAGLDHDCGTSRAVGYFLEPLALISLWGKKPLAITLRGITNDSTDCGVDVWRTVTLPLLRQLTGAEDYELKVRNEGWRREVGGQRAHSVVACLLAAHNRDAQQLADYLFKELCWAAPVPAGC